VRLCVRPHAPRSQVAGGQRTRMDLQTRDRASSDVAEVPAGEPGVPLEGAERSQEPGSLGALRARLRAVSSRRAQQLLAAVILVVLAAMAWHFNAPPRHAAVSPVPDTLRVLAASVVLFGAAGLGLTRLLLPAALRRYEPLWILPTGACAV